MGRLIILLCALVVASGCTGDGHMWDEALKDLRGENMEMHMKPPAAKDLWD